ncbi:MAG: type I methionyl aminopeptidase [Myxococcaceae bacterium]|nr:type I methionyl aminopeptidase [Myxococcaceae bacterium]
MNVITPAPKALLRPPPVLPRPNEPCWCGSSEKYKKCHKEADGVFLREERVRLEKNRVMPGVVSPMREVPLSIRRPDYAATGTPARGDGSNVRTAEELVRMRRACAAAARVMRITGEAVKPGITTDALDAIAHDATCALGGYPSPLNYRGFPKSICTSVNEVICHGIPDSRPLQNGDIVNLDITVYLDGMHGDCNATFLVGEVDEESKQLVRVTRECLELGIAAVKPGRPLNDIGRAIEQHADKYGYGVVRSYCGHGIGSVFHTPLQVPHYYDARANEKMVEGMTFTIEPMINAGSHEDALWPDDWTAVTKDLRRSAQFEHTILVTKDGAEVLTVER